MLYIECAKEFLMQGADEFFAQEAGHFKGIGA